MPDATNLAILIFLQKQKQLAESGTHTNVNKQSKREILREIVSLRNRDILPEHEHLNHDFIIEEVLSAIKLVKQGKAPGPHGIHNEYLANSGNNMVKWLTKLFNICYNTRIPKMWRCASVVSLLKPGKQETSPQSYRRISPLCTTYKLIECLILTRINPLVDPLLPHDQAGSRLW